MREERETKTAFLVGGLTVTVLCGILLAFAAARLGPAKVARLGRTVLVGPPDDRLPPLPADVLAELVRLGAVVDNAENPTASPEHDNLLVRPDERRVYVLRQNAAVAAFILATRQSLNLDPPAVYVPSGAPMSPVLQEFLARHTRLRYSITVDGRGFRRTLPAVASAHRILVVGDSVAFGLGVDDGQTMASALQSLLGGSVQVVNAGVGEYDADLVYRAAEALSAESEYEALVYVACQNDFDDRRPDLYLGSAQLMLERLAGLAPRFGGRVVVLLTTALEHTAYDILQDAGWPREQQALTTHLREGLPATARRLGFAYLDLAEPIARSSQQAGTLFQRFAFYVDHVHLSPQGNRLAAAELHRALGTLEGE